jgi:hypothetical protein
VRGQTGKWLRVDQHESDPAGFGAAIHPGVIRTLLHEDIAGLEMDFRVIQEHIDLA